MAVNCTGTPRGVVGLDGVTAIETSVAAVTVRFADSVLLLLLMPSSSAEIVVTPVARVDALPSIPDVLPTVAVAMSDDTQVTFVVMSPVLSSK